MGIQKVEKSGESEGGRVLQDFGRICFYGNDELRLEEGDNLSRFAFCDENGKHETGRGATLQNLNKVLCKCRGKNQPISENKRIQGGGGQARRHQGTFYSIHGDVLYKHGVRVFDGVQKEKTAGMKYFIPDCCIFAIILK